MLGELICEELAELTPVRVLESDGEPEIEVSFRARRAILGVEMVDLGTYVAVVRVVGQFEDGARRA
jgi:hypothetical protein